MVGCALSWFTGIWCALPVALFWKGWEKGVAELILCGFCHWWRQERPSRSLIALTRCSRWRVAMACSVSFTINRTTKDIRRRRVRC